MENIEYIKFQNLSGAVAAQALIPILMREFLAITGQPGLQNKFQNSQSYTEIMSQ